MKKRLLFIPFHRELRPPAESEANEKSVPFTLELPHLKVRTLVALRQELPVIAGIWVVPRSFRLRPKGLG